MGHVSDLAGEREIHEFFSFSGDIEHVEILRFVPLFPIYNVKIDFCFSLLRFL